MQYYDVIVVGAGAAGMMCAASAGARGRSVLIVDHAEAAGKKIRISGGGRCNFTNVNANVKNYISQNPRFAISALKRYTPKHFIDLVQKYGITYHEKTLGQLFCNGSSQQIVDMMLSEMRAVGVKLEVNTTVDGVVRDDDGYLVSLSSGNVRCQSLVVASGGKSIPKMGATGFAYEIAEQFGVEVLPTRPGLVPLTFDPSMLSVIAPLSGIAVDGVAKHGKTTFEEAILFTHRGLSGPAILQISSYWREGDSISLDLAAGFDFAVWLEMARKEFGRQSVLNALSHSLPRRLVQMMVEKLDITCNVGDMNKVQSTALAKMIKDWEIKPVGSEGYRTAEVTLGGINTDCLNASDMQVKTHKGLYFIGEAVDVTGWLGGYNFQWAWASGWCAGQTA